MSPDPSPPRLAVRLLAAVLPRTGRGEAVLGDLHEEFVGRSRTGPRRARWWYTRQAVAIALSYGLRSAMSRRINTSGLPRADSSGPRRADSARSRPVRSVSEVGATLVFDARYAARRLAREWRFTIPAVLVLALGIGVNSATFSVVNQALFQPLQFGDVDRLVNIYQNQGRSAEPVGSSFPAYGDMSRQTEIFSGVTAFTWPLPVRYRAADRISSGLVEYAASNYLQVHDLNPSLGRWFTTVEDQPGVEVVAVVNHRTWVSRFDADPSVLGSTVRIDGVPATIVGVGPADYSSSLHSGLVSDFWLPISAAAAISGSIGVAETRASNEFMVRARLRNGVSLEQARAAMTALGTTLAREYPQDDPGRGISVLPADEVVVHPQLDRMVDAGASFLMVVVALLLAIACSNLATWLLVRGLARGKEVAVRLALGASRAQVVRQLLVESTVLAGAGGAIGYLLGTWALGLAATLDLPLDVDGGLDHRVVSFTLGLALVTGVVFGLAPALAVTRGRLGAALRGDGGLGRVRARRFGLKHTLVVSQVVLSCLLLGVEGVYVRALAATRSVDLGFEVARLAFVETDAAFAGYGADEAAAFQERLRQNIAALPGVESVTRTMGPPIGWDGAGAPIIEGERRIDDESSLVPWVWADPDYFDVLGIPLLRGRGFSATDRSDTPRVAVVNESLAARYFGARSPIGRRLSIAEGVGPSDGAPPLIDFEIIGVVPDVRTSLQDPPRAMFYRSIRQGGGAPSTLVVRAAGNPGGLLSSLRSTVREVDDAVPIIEATTLDARVARELGPARTLVGFLGVLGVLGLGLASLGLYAVVSYAVSRRSREIGIRTALGAPRREVVWTLSKDVALQMTIGLGMGLALAWLAVQNLGALVSSLGRAEGVNLNAAPAADPLALAFVALVMALVGFGATLYPAWRATRSAPLEVLRDL